jgi:hypothetical protein
MADSRIHYMTTPSTPKKKKKKGGGGGRRRMLMEYVKNDLQRETSFAEYILPHGKGLENPAICRMYKYANC